MSYQPYQNLDIEDQNYNNNSQNKDYNYYDDSETKKSNFLSLYFFIHYLTILVQYAVRGVIFIIMKDKDYDLSILFLFEIILNSWKILYNLIFLLIFGKKLPGYRSTYLIQILLYLGNLVAVLGFYLYFTDKIDKAQIYYFCIPLIVLTLIRSVLGIIMKARFIPGESGYFVESIFILLLALKLGGLVSMSWTYIFLFWYICSIFVLIFAVIMIIIFLIFLCSYERKDKDSKFLLVFLAFFALLVCFIGVSFFNCAHGLKKFFEKKEYDLLYWNGYSMAIGFFIFVLLFTCLFFVYIGVINNYLEKNKQEKMSLYGMASKAKSSTAQYKKK